ncbi:hypothetical protein FVR03_14240 [Pontibacter qinzhouensis]|uniref:Uncharacterized protein n=1 Tax=Pontibacter qinzhouensis TaxID=2603253 RepID=A0A5C8JMX9_9BACT|nr:hypothetical protein [Pontibacter qinzhouensis]TXK38143.1 hypothetical protein FVR03_14240 [Pontibacter qinzhouensis]
MRSSCERLKDQKLHYKVETARQLIGLPKIRVSGQTPTAPPIFSNDVPLQKSFKAARGRGIIVTSEDARGSMIF